MRLAKLITLALSLTALVALSACGPKYPNCDSDKQCRGVGEYCFNKTCVKCIDDSHCAELGPCGRCNVGSHTCEGTTGNIGDCCSLDSDCSSNVCLKGANDLVGKCVECIQNTDCGQGMKCANYRCVPDTECSDETPCPAGKKCESGRCVADVCQLQNIYFDFDEYAIRADARDVLNNDTNCMRERGIENVSLEGHCDDRGADEYNLALGNRRANAVKKFLKTLGLRDGNMSTISYGEERPTCMDATESCWGKNRRVEVLPK